MVQNLDAFATFARTIRRMSWNQGTWEFLLIELPVLTWRRVTPAAGEAAFDSAQRQKTPGGGQSVRRGAAERA